MTQRSWCSPEHVSGQQVVPDDAPVDRPEHGHDRVVAAADQGVVLGWFAVSTVGGALGLDHIHGDPQRHLPVDPSSAAGQFAAVVLDGDLVAEEPRRARAGVGDQRFVRREFQLELFAQEHRKTLFDLFGLGLGPGEPEQVVIGVAHVTQPAVSRIIRVTMRQAAHLPAQGSDRSPVPASAGCGQLGLHLDVGRVTRPAPTSGVFQYQHCLDKGVQLVQVDVGQDR